MHETASPTSAVRAAAPEAAKRQGVLLPPPPVLLSLSTTPTQTSPLAGWLCRLLLRAAYYSNTHFTYASYIQEKRKYGTLVQW